MTIWDDDVVQRLYARLAIHERNGLELIIKRLRKTYPKIDIYESILAGGPALSAGKKLIDSSKGMPLFVITRPTKNKPSCIKIRIDSKNDRKKLESALGHTWEKIHETKFYLSDFQGSSDQFEAFLNELSNTAVADVTKKRSNGNGYNPSDYNELIDYPAENEQGLMEGAKATVTVNKYERNRKARRECISHYGSACYFCGVDFGKIYGDAYAGFIHVHHIVPLSEIKEKYSVDPIRDLLPVCPNCHAVIHFSGDALSLDEAKSILSAHNK